MISRRDFLKSGAGGTAALMVGAAVSGVSPVPAQAALPVQTLNFRIVDAVKEMVTHNSINDARCYFWVYKEDHYPPDCPGPMVYATYGQRIQLILTNDLDEPHSLFIPGIFNSGPVAPGQTIFRTFTARRTGTFLYYDNLNAPVNRMMGLYGSFVVMPRGRVTTAARRMTPYNAPTPMVQRLFNDLGAKPWWPGLAWEGWDADTSCPAYRQHCWIINQASPRLNAEVGSLPAGVQMSGAEFMQKFLRDPFSPTKDNNLPQYFTINGQSGHYAHNSPYTCPMWRVGEPCLIRILNAGLWTHSTHIHANHVYVVAVNGVPQRNPLWVDTFTAHPLDTYDWLVPYMRCPDVPNARGIGRADAPLPTLAGGTTWPPEEELGLSIPSLIGQNIPGVSGLTALDQQGNPIDLGVELSPLCFPMHDHSEPSQTAQGGNYNCGLISGINFIGDRNQPGGVRTFPMSHMIEMAMMVNSRWMHGYYTYESAPAFD